MPPKGILVTGFEPFGDQSINVSWEVASRLPSEIDGVRLLVKKLPVVYDESRKAVKEILDENEWITDVILLGEYGGLSVLEVEMIGVNCDDTTLPDNRGIVRKGQRIIENAPDGLFTTLPVREIVKYLNQQCDSPAAVSWSAGQFLCNHTLFGTLHEIQHSERNIRAGFVHLPYTSAQGAKSKRPGLPAEDMARSVQHIVEYLVKY